ncbi:hypothetical protein V3C99_001781 [Haemonchus contortus]
MNFTNLTDEDEWLDDFHPGQILGGVVIVLSTALLITQVLFISVNIKKCGFSTDFAYTLMCLITIMDIMQLSFHDMIGVILCFQLRLPSFITIVGAFMGSSWMVMAINSVLLSFHRLVWTIWPFQAHSILPPRFLKAILAVIFLIYCLLLGIMLSPLSEMTFSVYYMMWYYNGGDSDMN